MAELWADGTYPIIEIYTGDTLATGRRRRGLGVEPMTCPPERVQTGDHVLPPEPGQWVDHGMGHPAIGIKPGALIRPPAALFHPSRLG